MGSPLLSNITPPRVALVDPQNGLISREWYRFFMTLFQLTGQGRSTTAIPDLELGPPSFAPEQLADVLAQAAGLLAQPQQESMRETVAELDKQVQALAVQPYADWSELVKQIQSLAVAPPQNPQVLWSSVLNQPRIEAYDTATSIALTSTPTLLKPATVAAGYSGIVYDAASGEFTFSSAGSYSLSLSVNATSSASNQFVYIYAENNTGSGWVVNTNSGKTYELTNANTVQIVYSQSVARVAGQKVRYWIYSNDGKVTLTTQSLPGSVGAIVPAIRVQYSS